MIVIFFPLTLFLELEKVKTFFQSALVTVIAVSCRSDGSAPGPYALYSRGAKRCFLQNISLNLGQSLALWSNANITNFSSSKVGITFYFSKDLAFFFFHFRWAAWAFQERISLLSSRNLFFVWQDKKKTCICNPKLVFCWKSSNLDELFWILEKISEGDRMKRILIASSRPTSFEPYKWWTCFSSSHFWDFENFLVSERFGFSFKLIMSSEVALFKFDVALRFDFAELVLPAGRLVRWHMHIYASACFEFKFACVLGPVSNAFNHGRSYACAMHMHSNCKPRGACTRVGRKGGSIIILWRP